MTFFALGRCVYLASGHFKCSIDPREDTKKDKCDEVVDTVDETVDYGRSLAKCTVDFFVL